MDIYRMQKYHPANFDENGVYKIDEWTDVSEIGSVFSGKVFTKEQYILMENLYVQKLKLIVESQNISSLRIFSDEDDVIDLDHSEKFSFGLKFEDMLHYSNGKWLESEGIYKFCRLCLRGIQGFALSDEVKFFIAFTGDYYVHIGCENLNDALKILLN